MINQHQKAQLFSNAVFAELVGSDIETEDLIEIVGDDPEKLEEARQYILKYSHAIQETANSASESWYDKAPLD